jgi:uncharacterized protein (TIGR00269 family)
MKCRICGVKAVVNMRQHKLALCKQHYLAWIPEQTLRFIEKYHMFSRDEKVLVAVSGGKDSLSLWDILQKIGIEADGLYICLGIGGRGSSTGDSLNYSFESQRLTEQFAAERGLKLHIVDVQQEYGSTIQQFASRSHRGRGKPCSVCGLVKRHVMNRIARDFGYDVLATGHNLDDEAAILFGNTLNWAGEYLLRQGPVLPGTPGLVRKVKPVCRIYERDMLAYALLRGIEYIYDECPFSTGSTSIYYKQLLNRMENDRPGVKLSFYLSFLEARKSGLFADRKVIQADLHPCPSCGQPTSAQDLCSFCRMMDRHAGS